MQARVLVIENDPRAPLDLVENWLTESGLQVDIIRAHAGQSVPNSLPAEYHGLIALGGAMGAHDDNEFSWLTPERSMMKDAIAQDFPFIGICLGAQILATAVDGKSIPTPTPEVGVIQVRIESRENTDQLFGPLAGKVLPATGWHQDYIVDLPKDAFVIGSSVDCPVQVFRLGQNVYGIQFHPEASTETVATWVKPSDQVLNKISKSGDQVIAEVNELRNELIDTWKPVFLRWASLIKDSALQSVQSNQQANS